MKKSVRSGQRVRDADVLRAADATEVSLFKELCAPTWKLVLFDGGTATPSSAPLKFDALPGIAQYAVIAGKDVRHDATNVYHDLDRVAHQVYGIAEPTALLIRPDNYIAAVLPGNDLAGLQRYLSTWYPTASIADPVATPSLPAFQRRRISNAVTARSPTGKRLRSRRAKTTGFMPA